MRFSEGFVGEPPRMWAEAQERSRNFTDLNRAIRWAERRADRVTVIVDDLGLWDDWPPDEHERQLIDDYVRHRRRRFQREFRERRSAPVEWFYAVRDPTVEEPETLADALAAQPEVQSVVQRERWWVIRLHARTAREADMLGAEAFTRLAWPDERIEREIGRGRSSYTFFLSHGGVTVFGLAEYEDEQLEQARRWR